MTNLERDSHSQVLMQQMCVSFDDSRVLPSVSFSYQGDAIGHETGEAWRRAELGVW